ncbi:thiol-disulfide oxidoreductase DCC family protein [Rugosimonospora acidiphila]
MPNCHPIDRRTTRGATQRGHVVDSSGFPLLVYDGDCAFCTRSVNLLRKRLPAFPQAQPWQQLDLAALGLTEQEVQDAVQWVDHGVHSSGGRVASELLRYQPNRALRMLGALCDTPPVRSVIAVVYRWVAAHRHQMPGGTAACAIQDRPSGPDRQHLAA